jgi:hypothetical protein
MTGPASTQSISTFASLNTSKDIDIFGDADREH